MLNVVFKNKIKDFSVSVSVRDWIKGFLILMVVADHNDFFRSIGGGYFRPLAIHVVGFFVLSFPSAYISTGSFFRFVSDRCVRYLWPFLIFYIIYSWGSYFFLGKDDITIQSFVVGLLTGSFVNTKQGCGGAFMWFLPALFGFVVFIRIVASLNRKSFLVLLLGSIFFHAFATELSDSLTANVPFGLLIGYWVFPLVVFFILLWSSQFFDKFLASPVVFILMLMVAVLSYSSIVSSKEYIEIGVLAGPSYKKPLLLALNLTHLVSGLVAIWQMGRYFVDKSVFICELGKYSLVIYLVHPAVFSLFNKISQWFLGGEQSLAFYLAIPSYIFTLAVAYIASRLIYKFGFVKKIFFPNGIRDLLCAFGFKQNAQVPNG